MEKIRVGVVFGGQSSEHEVSLQSAKNIVDALDKSKFDVVLLGVDKQGQWHISDTSNYLINADNPETIELNSTNQQISVLPGAEQSQLVNVTTHTALSQIDVIFPIVHGTLGEDGTLQGMLRILNIPFVGSDVLGSSVCMDKDVCKRLLRDAGLNVAPFVTVTRANPSRYTFADLEKSLGLPLFIKPANQGSSVGVSRVTNEAEFTEALTLAFRYDSKVVIEKGIKGREIECGILGNDNPQASRCGEIVVKGGFYSYDTKYIDGEAAQLFVPAKLDKAIEDTIRDVAIRAFQATECFGLARVDVFLTDDNEVIVNEINTLPGFTKISMYPKMWGASGIGYSDLITHLIELALERHQSSMVNYSR